MGDLLPSCKEAARLQSDALDRSLPFRQRFGLRVHLLLCKWCRRYGEQIAFLRTAVHTQAQGEECLPSRALSSEAKERMKQRLRAEGK